MIYKNTSNNIKISVVVHYDPYLSSKGNYLWHYFISIENLNPFGIRLVSRYWNIVDEASVIREIEGEGVVGNQHIINPNQSYEYNSNVVLSTQGIMAGIYKFENLSNDTIFDAQIPSFSLDIPEKLIIKN